MKLRSLGQFAQRPLAPVHDFPGGSHLRVEIRIGGSKLDAFGSEDNRQIFADRGMKVRQHLLGQDNTGAIADFGDLERHVHTSVITALGVEGNALRGGEKQTGLSLAKRAF